MSGIELSRLRELETAVAALRHEIETIERWGRLVADALTKGGRLLAAGNGGSAAHAQHLTAELVGRYVGERRPLSAIALHADTSAVTAIVNDYGAHEMFARGVRAHGRPGDVLVALSTSGESRNILAAAHVARELDLRVLAFTGVAPNPLCAAADEAMTVCGSTPTIQEIHQICIHLLCEAIDAALDSQEAPRPAGGLLAYSPSRRSIAGAGP